MNIILDECERDHLLFKVYTNWTCCSIMNSESEYCHNLRVSSQMKLFVNHDLIDACRTHGGICSIEECDQDDVNPFTITGPVPFMLCNYVRVDRAVARKRIYRQTMTCFGSRSLKWTVKKNAIYIGDLSSVYLAKFLRTLCKARVPITRIQSVVQDRLILSIHFQTYAGRLNYFPTCFNYYSKGYSKHIYLIILLIFLIY